MERYQIFISYRRDGGDALAGRLADRFNALGYKVFYDVESMRSGTFNTQILDAVAQCSDVLLVLPPNALDRCINADDWVRRELAFALKNNKNVIPVIMRGFEFPQTLPADIDKIRYMEGVTASSEYFDAVIDRIESLLTDGLKKVDKTKFPVFEDPEFPEDVIQDIILYYLLKLPIPEEIKDKVNKSLGKYFSLHPHRDYKGLPGRNVLHTVQYSGKWYNIYDVFCKDGKKYAYGLLSDVKPTEQQTGVFFHIDESDNVKPILIGVYNASFTDVDITSLFTWYTNFRRGLGIVPDVLLPLYETQVRQLKMLSAKDVKSYSGLLGIDDKEVNEILNLEADKAVEELRSINENLLYTRIMGSYNCTSVVLGNGNCYASRAEGRNAGKLIKTPLKKKIILDIVPTMIENHYIALVYGQVTKKKVVYLSEGPEYYLITKKEGDLEFEKISESNIEFWCGKYFERFALIYMQTKLQTLDPFFKK